VKEFGQFDSEILYNDTPSKYKNAHNPQSTYNPFQN